MPKPPTPERGRRPSATPTRSGAAARPARVRRPPRERAPGGWRPLATELASLAGLGISAYLTLAHYSTAVSLVCAESGAINCQKVTTSPQSIFLGIPVALLGLLFYVAMVVICWPGAWRSALRYLPALRLGAAISGVLFVFRLLYAELFQIRAICLWCSAVHLVTLVLFGLIVTGWEDALELRDLAATGASPEPEED
jgi:uncharacterized membrane protein